MGLHKRKASGNWQASFKDPNGHRVFKTFETKREGQEWLEANRTDARRGDYVPPSDRTVTEAVSEWLAEAERTKVNATTLRACRPTTLRAYRTDAENYVIPRLGRVPLTALTRGAVREQLVVAMHADGLSHATISRALVVLRMALDRELEAERIKANPAAGLKLGKLSQEDRPKPSFTEAQLLRLAASAPNDEARALIGVMAGAALRIGEGLGLRVMDLWHPEHEHAVTVAQQVVSAGGGTPKTGPPKTDSSAATVPVLAPFRPHLELARLLAGDREPTALLFLSPTGLPRHRATVTRDWLHIAQDAAGLPRTGWHALRRSALLLPEVTALSPIDQRDFARHRNVSETHDTYQRQGSEATTRRLIEALG